MTRATALLAALLLASAAGAQTPGPPPEPTPTPAPVTEPAAQSTATPATAPATPTGEAAAAAPEAVSLQAVRQEFVEDRLWKAAGDVRLAYQDVSVACDELELDQQTMVIEARGHVVIDQGPTRLACSRATYDLRKKVGVLHEASGFLPPTYHFRAAVLEKLDETHYRFTDGVFTSCTLTEDDAPPWSIEVSEALLEVEGYGHFRNMALEVQGVPVFYTPRMLWPLKRERAFGLLVPNIGYNNRRGAYLGTALFVPVGRSLDTTFYLDGYSKGFLGLGSEVRWAPAENARGGLLLSTIRDAETGRWEWKALGSYNQLIAGGWALKAELEEYSDLDFFQRFERTFERTDRRQLYSFLSVSRSWGAQAINLKVDHSKTFGLTIGAEGQSSDVVLQRLPELEYRLRATRIGRSPFYASGIALADRLSVDRPSGSGSYGRFDLFPQISMLTPGFAWLSVTPTVGLRQTYYTASNELGPFGNPVALVDEGLSRRYLTAGATLVGPSLSRIWANGESKLKHLIEPRVEYVFVSDPGDLRRIPVFDERDATVTANNLVRMSFANRLFYKRGETASREIASLEVSQSYSFSDDLTLANSGLGLAASHRGPLSVALRTNPLPQMLLDAQVNFDAVTDELVSTLLTAGVGGGPARLNLTWSSSRSRTGEVFSSQLGVGGGVGPTRGPWRLEAFVDYDLHSERLLRQRYVLNWRGSCWSARAELHDSRFVGFETRDYRIAIDLTGLGTFLDIHGKLDAYSDE